jgi:transposase
MAYRELTVVEVREILRRWRSGASLRDIAASMGADRKTVRRYVEAAQHLGLAREEGSRLVDDDLVGEVVLAVLPGAPVRVGAARDHCRANRDVIEAWVRDGCKVPKIVRLLQRHTGRTVPERTLGRFIAEELQDAARAGTTVRIDAPPPGKVLEIDFMEVGRMTLDGVERKLHALVCVAAYSRHLFVWPCLTTTRADVIEGLDAAWAFFGGVFPVVVADNPRAIVSKADPVAPVLGDDIIEYSQSRGFVFDLARVRRPKDKPKVERAVSYVRSDGFAGERMLDLHHARRHIETWCRDFAGQRVHGATRKKPVEVFLAEERSLLQPAPTAPYDPPAWVTLKVGRDHAVTVAQALYSVPYTLRGRSLRARYDRQTVKLYDGGLLVKVHPRVAIGASRIDPDDLPPGTAELATRDAESLQERAARCGEAVGEYAGRLLEGELPWTRMRQVYRLLGLCKRYGDHTVNVACRSALALDVIEVTRIDRMLQNGLERGPTPPPPARGVVVRPRFGRDPSEFRSKTPQSGENDAS